MPMRRSMAAVTPLEMIRANADLAVTTARNQLGVELLFDRHGVEWVDGHLNRIREHLSDSARAGVVNVMGSFVGECIVRSQRGEWIEKPGEGWQVRLRRQNEVTVNVFSKIEKQLAAGEGDSILSLFDWAPLIAEKGLTAQPPAASQRPAAANVSTADRAPGPSNSSHLRESSIIEFFDRQPKFRLAMAGGVMVFVWGLYILRVTLGVGP